MRSLAFEMNLDQAEEAPTSAADRVSACSIRARAAQAIWRQLSLHHRLRFLGPLRRLIAENHAALAQAAAYPGRATCAEEVLVSEVLPLAEACQFLQRNAARVLKPRRCGQAGRPLWLHRCSSTVLREPFGLVLIIGPSNYPLFLAGVQALQAVVAGNAVLWKPGRGGHAAAELFRSLMTQAGLPPDLVQVLSEAPEDARQAMAVAADKVIFTGSAEVGRKVLGELGKRALPAVAELSGHDAVFVRPDADLELTANALVFGLRLNGGGTCIAPRRVFVARPLAEELATRLHQMARTISVRTARDAAAHERLREALDHGARLIAGTLGDPPQITLPLILSEVSPGTRLLAESAFLPILTLTPVDSDDEAIALANESEFALGATIFGGEAGARALAERVRAGVVVINDMIVPTADPRLPFGGRGASGFGVTRGIEGLLEMTAVKVISIRGGRWRPHLLHDPQQSSELVARYLLAAHASWWKRITAWPGLLRSLMNLLFAKGRES